MTLDQQIRRWFNRTRRSLIGAGATHEPVVLIEGAKRPPLTGRPWTPARMARFAAGFVLTGAALFFLYVGWAAQLGRITPSFASPPPAEGESHAVAGLGFVAGFAGREDAYRDGSFLAPSGRQRRMAAFQAGAAKAADEALAALAFAPAAAADVEAARAALATLADAGADPAKADAAKLALARLARVGAPAIDAASQQRLAAAAAAASDRIVATLAALGKEGHVGPAGRATERVFFAARGEAFAWRIVLQGLASDAAPDLAAAIAAPTARASESWAIAAGFQPLFVLNGPNGATFSPNHPAELGLRVALAGVASRQLAEAAGAEIVAPKPPPRRRRG